jgi:hypothetical protein
MVLLFFGVLAIVLLDLERWVFVLIDLLRS